MLEVQCTAYPVYAESLQNRVRNLEKLLKTCSDREVLNKEIDTDNHRVLKKKFSVMLERELST